MNPQPDGSGGTIQSNWEVVAIDLEDEKATFQPTAESIKKSDAASRRAHEAYLEKLKKWNPEEYEKLMKERESWNRNHPPQ